MGGIFLSPFSFLPPDRRRCDNSPRRLGEGPGVRVESVGLPQTLTHPASHSASAAGFSRKERRAVDVGTNFHRPIRIAQEPPQIFCPISARATVMVDHIPHPIRRRDFLGFNLKFPLQIIAADCGNRTNLPLL